MFSYIPKVSSNFSSPKPRLDLKRCLEFLLPLILCIPVKCNNLLTAHPIRAFFIWPWKMVFVYKCLLFVSSANRWKDQNVASMFSHQRKNVTWRRHCLIGQSCCSIRSKQSMGWFLESSSSVKFFSQAFA